MIYYLIVCRSLTYAQRTERALARAGVTAHILRSPAGIGEEGCSHSVRVAERHFSAALTVLDRAGLFPKRVVAAHEDGSYREVLLR